MLTFLGFDFILIGIGCVALMLLSLCNAPLSRPVALAVPVRGSQSSSAGRVRMILRAFLQLSIWVGWGVGSVAVAHIYASGATVTSPWAYYLSAVLSFNAPMAYLSVTERYPAARLTALRVTTFFSDR